MEEVTKQSDSQVLNQEKKELRWDLNNFLKPQRLEGEEFIDYKQRQKVQKMFLKERLKGKMWWVSIGKHWDKEQQKWLFVGPYTYNKKQYAAAKEAYDKHMKEKEQNIQTEQTEQIKTNE